MFKFIHGAAFFVPLTKSARVKVDLEENHLSTEEEWHSQSPTLRSGTGFACPRFCSECCRDYTSLTGLVSDYLVVHDHFKCTFPEHERHLLDDQEFHEENLGGRECTEPEADPDDPHVWEMLCRFSEEEKQVQAWNQIGDCHMDPSVVSFESWLGVDSCSFTTMGRAFARLTGATTFGFVDAGLRAMISHNPMLTCRYKATQFHGLGYYHGEETASDMQNELCTRMRDDSRTGRLDAFHMGLWALGTGELTNITAFPKPTTPPRTLQKNLLPGWPARQVAYETFPEDPKPINDMGGAVQCAIIRLRNEPMEDEVVTNRPGRNSYGRTEDDPHGPRWPSDVREAYYDHFTIYQDQGIHFDVPFDQLMSDDTVSKLVFQGIGAHHLEVIRSDGTNAVDLNYISLGGCAGVPAGHGCPIPLDQALASLPEQARREARYAVRMEGLYDDVPLRVGLARWGGNAFFDEAGQLIALQHKGETKLAGSNDRAWDLQKFTFRSSLVATVTAVDHLMNSHILMAETLAISTMETLAPTDHLRLLLAPHTYGTLSINNVASMNLFAGRMLVHRGSPFADDGFEPEDGSTGKVWAKSAVLRIQKFGDTYNAYRAHRNSRSPEIPFFEDGILFYRALERYVSAFIDEAYGSEPEQCNHALTNHATTQRFVRTFFAQTDPATPDLWPAEMREAGSNCASLKALLTESIFAVTGIHRHVGSVSDYYREYSFASTVWPEGELMARPKQGFLTLLLAATTNSYFPKMDDGMNLMHIYEDQPGAQRVFESFVQDLAEVQTEIDRRNEARVAAGNLAFHQFEPKIVEWAIMI